MHSPKKDLIYDPDQDVDEKRDIRKKYRNLQKSIEETNSTECSVDNITQIVRDADDLFGKVKGPQEATLDSAVFLMASSMSAQKARAMKSSSGAFDSDDFISRLITFLGGRNRMNVDESDLDEEGEGDTQLEWERIGRKALAKSRRVPTMDFMLGPLSIELKKRAVVKRAKLEKNKEEMKKPQEIREEDIARSENETSRNVLLLEKLLEEHERINLFRFIINPKDFAQSVENLFHLSFLIRDGKVALETSTEGEPEIYLCEPPTDEDRASGTLRKRQIVMEFDMATWKQAIEVFNITKPIIPQRPPAQTRIGDKWYG